LDITKTDYKALRGNFEERAEKEVKKNLIFEKIQELENIIATEEEVEEKISEYANKYPDGSEEFRKKVNEQYKEAMKQSIISKKIVDLLVENAKVIK
jgi:trigger factor